MKTPTPKNTSKAAAIRHARATISELSRFGCGWVYLYRDGENWRESIPREYHQAVTGRRRALIFAARHYLNPDLEHPFTERGDFVGGSWTDYV